MRKVNSHRNNKEETKINNNLMMIGRKAESLKKKLISLYDKGEVQTERFDDFVVRQRLWDEIDLMASRIEDYLAELEEARFWVESYDVTVVTEKTMAKYVDRSDSARLLFEGTYVKVTETYCYPAENAKVWVSLAPLSALA